MRNVIEKIDINHIEIIRNTLFEQSCSIHHNNNDLMFIRLTTDSCIVKFWLLPCHC